MQRGKGREEDHDQRSAGTQKRPQGLRVMKIDCRSSMPTFAAPPTLVFLPHFCTPPRICCSPLRTGQHRTSRASEGAAAGNGSRRRPPAPPLGPAMCPQEPNDSPTGPPRPSHDVLCGEGVSRNPHAAYRLFLLQGRCRASLQRRSPVLRPEPGCQYLDVCGPQ